MEWIFVVPYAVLGITCLLVGYLLGARRAREVKQRVLRDLNAQSLELLDARSSLHCLEQYASQQDRKDRLLQLTLQKLQHANARGRHLTRLMDNQDKKHFVEIARLRLQVVEAQEAAQKADMICEQTTAQLTHLLDQASPAMHTPKTNTLMPVVGRTSAGLPVGLRKRGRTKAPSRSFT